MPFTLFHAVVPPYQQTLSAMIGLIEKGEAYCGETGTDPTELLEARLHPDMLPLAYQFKSTAVHSAGAIADVRAGRSTSDYSDPGNSFAAVKERITQAQRTLSEVSADDLDSLVGKPMRFEYGPYYADFTAESFLLHFSLPNFYFHATTAYDILRSKGLALGKGDFLGGISLKRAE